MRIFLAIRITFIASLFLVSVSSADIQKNFRLTIKAVDHQASMIEPIEIQILLESYQGAYRIYSHLHFGISAAVGPDDWLRFEIVSPSGIRIKDYGTRHPGPLRPYKGDHADVTPGASYTERINIYPSAFDKGVHWPESGTYKIKAIYSYKQNPKWKYGRDLWEGKLESNWITINLQSAALADSFTLAVMRTDGILIPIASHRDDGFTNFWPEYEELSRMKISSVEELPPEWLEDRISPSKQWLFTDFKGNRKNITLAETRTNLQCDITSGIDTDIEKKPYECDYCCPYPKVGIVSDKDLNLAPVMKTDMAAQFSNFFNKLYGDDVIQRLNRAFEMKQDLLGKSDTSFPTRLMLEPNNISIYKIPNDVPIYYYEMTLARDLDSYDAECPAYDVRQGWIRENHSGELRSISTKTTATDCDFKEPDMIIPHLYFKFRGKSYFIAEELGYEWEIWAVYEIDEDEIEAVVSTLTHAL